MLAIYKKELRTYLASMIGYVFIAFILVIVGIYFTAYNLNYAYPLFAYTISGVVIVFLITVPLLTMRIIAEETKQKTDQLLYTSPISIGKIIMGKYLALLTVFLIPIAIICLYPLIMAQFGTVTFAGAYTAILGFFLLGCADIAIGMFISSITESQIIAAVVTIGVIYLCTYMMSGISSLVPETAIASLLVFSAIVLIITLIVYGLLHNIFIAGCIAVIGEMVLIITYVVKSNILEGAVQKLMNVFNLYTHFTNFLDDILDINSLVYFVSVIVFFLYLTTQTIQKRRWS